MGSELPFVAPSTIVRSRHLVGDEDHPGLEHDRNGFQKWDRSRTRPTTAERLSLHGVGWRHVSRVRMVCITGPSHVLAALRRSLYALERSHRGGTAIYCPHDGWWRFGFCFSGLSDFVCNVCSCFDRTISRYGVFSSVAFVRNSEPQFSKLIFRNVSEMRRVRWDFRPSIISVFLAGMAWVHSWRASSAMTKRLLG
jgi:hypothetical protein